MGTKALIRILLFIFLFNFSEQVWSSSLERDLYGFTTLLRLKRNKRLAYLDAIPDSKSLSSLTYSQDDDGFTIQNVRTPIGHDVSKIITAKEYSAPYEEPFEEDIETNNDPSVIQNEPEESSPHIIPYSEHEIAKDIPTSPKYTVPGKWAKPSSKTKNLLNFTPTKIYSQVRGTHTVKRLPRHKAIDTATTDEERANAPRLRAVVTNSKINTVYTEEGYEDSAYDHAGQTRDADLQEGYARKLHDQTHSGLGFTGNIANTKSNPKKPAHGELDEYENDYGYHLEKENEEAKEDSKMDQNGNYKGLQKRLNLDPKVFAKNGIKKLEEDLEKEIEEVEKGSEDYESRNDYDYNTNSESLETTVKDKKQNKKLGSRNVKEKMNKLSNGSQGFLKTSMPEIQDDSYEEKIKADTSRFDQGIVIPQGTKRFEETISESMTNNHSPTSPQHTYHLNELQSNNSITPQIYNSSNIHDMTNVSYNDLQKQFWNLINSREIVSTAPLVYAHDTKDTIPLPILLHETTILRPQNIPITLTAINKYGPSLRIIDNQVPNQTQNPTQAEVVQPTNLADIQQLTYSGTAAQQNTHRRVHDIHPVYPANVASYTNIDPALLSLSVYEIWEPNRARDIPFVVTEPSVLKFSDNFAFTNVPIYSITALPVLNSELTRKPEMNTKYKSNLYLNPEVHTTYGNMINEGKTEDEIQIASKVNAESFTPIPELYMKATLANFVRNNKKNENEEFFRHASNPKYNKMLNYIKNQKNIKSINELTRSRRSSDLNEKRNEGKEKDFTIKRSSTLGEVKHPDFVLDTNGNIVDRLSISQESKTSQRIEQSKPIENQEQLYRYRNDAFNNIYPDSASIQHNCSFRSNSHSVPSPLPSALKIKDEYIKHHDVNNEHYRIPRSADSSYKRNFKQVKSHVLSPEEQTLYLNNQKTGTRKRRLSEVSKDVIVECGVKQRFDRDTLKSEMLMNGRNNDKINGKVKSRLKRSLLLERVQENAMLKTVNLQLLQKSRERKEKGLRKKRNNEELLNEAPKIVGDIVGKEIDKHFDNTSKDRDEKREDDVEVEIPELDYLEELKDTNDMDITNTTMKATINFNKYPFYRNENIPRTSALQYAVNSHYVPKKTLGGMEFYESRNVYMECDEMNPNLEQVVPDDEEPMPSGDLKKDLPRLQGLDGKLDCFKAKYFDKNPLDNPLFFEENVSQVTSLVELNPQKFVSKLLQLPEQNNKYNMQAMSKKLGLQKPQRRPHGSHSRINKSKETLPEKYTSGMERSKDVSTKAPYHNFGKALMDNPTRITRNDKWRMTKKLTTMTTEVPIRDSISSKKRYQKQVYDDVLGTIENMASMQGTINVQGVVAPMETLTSAPLKYTSMYSINATPSNHVPNYLKKRYTKLPIIDAARNSQSEQIKQVMLSPLSFPLQQQNRLKSTTIVPYKTDRILYKTKARTKYVPDNEQFIDHYRGVTVHKRSVNNDERFEETKMNSRKTLSRGFVNILDLDLQVKQNRRISRQVNSETPSTTLKPPRRRRKPRILTTPGTTAVTSAANTGEKEDKNDNQKTVYTIRGRTRHSRNREDVGKNGTVSTEQRTSDVMGVRKKGPRYSQIKRRKGSGVSSIAEVSPSIEATKAVDSIMPSFTGSPVTTTFIKPDINGTIDEREQLHQTEHPMGQTNKMYYEKMENFPGYSGNKSDIIDIENEDKQKDIVKEHHVHMNVQEFTASSIDKDNARSRSYSNEELNSDKEQENKNEDTGNSKEDDSRIIKKSRPYKDSDEETLDGSMENMEERDNKKTFFRYPTRSDSLVRDFENERYDKHDSRVNKSGFRQLPFKYDTNKRRHSFDTAKDESKEDEEESTEDNEEMERYVFPWSQDMKDSEEESKYISSYGRFEYPWEKRERLTRKCKGEKDGKKYKERSRDEYYDDDDDDDEGVSSSTNYHEKYVYPWERYNVPSKDRVNNEKHPWKSSIFDDNEPLSSNIYERFTFPWNTYEMQSKGYNLERTSKKNSIFDNDKMASEYRPMAKFSSKYSLNKFRLPVDNEPIVISISDSNKIRKSIASSVNEELAETTTDHPNVTSTTTSTTTPTTLIPTLNMRLFNARIIPENIATVPRKQGREKITMKSNRIKLKTFMKPTIKPIETSTRIEETTNPLRKKIRSKVSTSRNNLTRNESQVATSTVKVITTSPNPIKAIEKVTARRHGNTTNMAPRTTISELSSSRTSHMKIDRNDLKQVANSEKPKSKRKRTRQPSSGIAVSSTIIRKKHQGSDKSSVVDLPDRTISKGSTHRNDNDNVDHTFEDSIPTSRTVERHSRVSKEEIISKTIYPEDMMYELDEDKGLLKNVNSKAKSNIISRSSILKQPEIIEDQQRSIKVNPIKSEHVKKVSIITKETPDHVYQTKEIDKDGVRGMYISITPNNNNNGRYSDNSDNTKNMSLLEEELSLKDAEMDELERRMEALDTFNRIKQQINRHDMDSNIDNDLSSDSYLIEKLPKKVPLQSVGAKKIDEDEFKAHSKLNMGGYKGEIVKKEKDGGERHNDGRNKKKSGVNFIKEPDRRLYYYIQKR